MMRCWIIQSCAAQQRRWIIWPSNLSSLVCVPCEMWMHAWVRPSSVMYFSTVAISITIQSGIPFELSRAVGGNRTIGSRRRMRAALLLFIHTTLLTEWDIGKKQKQQLICLKMNNTTKSTSQMFSDSKCQKKRLTPTLPIGHMTASIFYLSINQAPNFQNCCHSTSFWKEVPYLSNHV